ncbi:MAG TPA: tetratricopeptide repeat protein, partial [Alphaproteobacteria bacterium]|nr:tetratricopeptide repeat protein [Alphaproteobacteria bacterium]
YHMSVCYEMEAQAALRRGSLSTNTQVQFLATYSSKYHLKAALKFHRHALKTMPNVVFDVFEKEANVDECGAKVLTDIGLECLALDRSATSPLTYGGTVDGINSRHRALRFFSMAFKKDPRAAYQLSYLFKLGIRSGAFGQPQALNPDLQKSLILLRYAAEKELPEAQNDLGYDYEQGIGVDKDSARALLLYQAAAEQGNKFAICNLAYCYQEGRGTDVDTAKATDLFAKVDKETLEKWERVRGLSE